LIIRPRPLRVLSPERAVADVADAVADLLPRIGAGEDDRLAYASMAPTSVVPAAGWLGSLGDDEGGAMVAMRLEPPTADRGRFAGVLQLQSRQDPSLVIDAFDLWSAPDAVLARFGDAEAGLLLALRRARAAWSPIGRLLDQPRPTWLGLHDDEVDELMGPVVDELAAAGVHVLWPAEMMTSVSLRPVVSTAPAAVTSSGLSLETLLELRWEASVDGDQITPEELRALAEARRPIVRLRGRWVRADATALARVLERRRIGAGEALAAALDGTLTVDGQEIDVELEGPLGRLAERLGALDPNRAVAPPPDLDAVLRPYQERGLAWLSEMADLGVGGVLADDMGLGKTIQVLALHLLRRDRKKPTLVVCPASVLANWERETARFAPGVPTRRFHGPGRDLEGLVANEIVVVTYGVVRRDAEALAAVDWGLVVADEAQAVKNPHSRTARALRRIHGEARFALTGTPVENRLTELWAILDWTTPGLLGPLDRFRTDIALPIERYQDDEVAERLRRVVRPFLLRRKKSDPTIAPDLPPKTETDRVVPLTREQAALYRAVTDEVLAQIESANGMTRRGLVLKLLTGLKQICNHPAHYLSQAGPLEGRSGKLDGVTELLEIVTAEDEAALVFTQYVAMGHLLVEHLTGRGLRTFFLHGGLSINAREELVARFQAGEADAFVISLRAGGTGINLTRATHVVHYDRWWNPAVEDQASDRAWRIGQTRPVEVHRLICEGTVEDRIATLLNTKRDLADAVVGSGEGWISELDDDALAELVELSGDGF
jgi:SNF2 family DNA or RNA helicase